MPPLHDVTVDIVFLVDASSDVRQDGFNEEKEFVKSVAKSLNVATGKSHAGVLVYNQYPRIPITLGSRLSTEEFVEILDSLPFIGGSRRIDRALQAAQTVLNTGRPDIPKIVILLTGGKQTPASGALSLDVAAQPLKEAGAKIFVVTIGPRPDLKELLRVVEDGGDIFTAPTFKGLRSLVQKVPDAAVNKISKCPLLSANGCL